MTRTDHWITAPKGQVKELLRVLLDLADDPHHVRYSGRGGEVFVPAYLAERWRTASSEPDPPHPPPSADKRASRRRTKEK